MILKPFSIWISEKRIFIWYSMYSLYLFW